MFNSYKQYIPQKVSKQTKHGYNINVKMFRIINIKQLYKI